MKAKSFYLLLSAACLSGYAWLAIVSREIISKSEVLCPLRHITGIPCPSCGSTRSVLSLLNGEWGTALLQNPFGIVLFAALLVAPLWMSYDLVIKKSSLYFFYQSFNMMLRRKSVAIPMIVIVLANWAWNIYKEK